MYWGFLLWEFWDLEFVFRLGFYLSFLSVLLPRSASSESERWLLCLELVSSTTGLTLSQMFLNKPSTSYLYSFMPAVPVALLSITSQIELGRYFITAALKSSMLMNERYLPKGPLIASNTSSRTDSAICSSIVINKLINKQFNLFLMNNFNCTSLR